MACILKLPGKSKGIVSFTHAENGRLISNVETRKYLNDNRDKWYYLLHHNWQPCEHDFFFDVSLCSKVDLQGGGPCLDMDCCNFSPSVYSPNLNEKIFDILYVARSVEFKRIELFYKVCKELLSKEPNLKILFICSVPEVDSDPIDPKSIYLNSFTREERKNFLALFFEYDYPFTVSKDFLSHFYKSSKIFLHMANNERHPRVCSYAWSTGIPVVGHKNLALFLPTEFQNEPYFYEVNDDSKYCDQIFKSLKSYDDKNYTMPYNEIKYFVNEEYSKSMLLKRLNDIFSENFDEKDFFLKNLDFRMGRHCLISLGDNSIEISIEELMTNSTRIEYQNMNTEEDPELKILRSLKK
jgi:hypothetical protein